MGRTTRSLTGVALLILFQAACSVSEVEVRLHEDLSGRFTTILAANREPGSCAHAPMLLQQFLKSTLEADANLKEAS